MIAAKRAEILAREGDALRQSLVRLVGDLRLADASRSTTGTWTPATRRLVSTADVVLLPYDWRDQPDLGVLVERSRWSHIAPDPHAVELLAAARADRLPRSSSIRSPRRRPNDRRTERRAHAHA